MLVLPSQQLWKPRSGSWWRKPWRAATELFAGHLQYGSASGHLKRNTAGHLSHTCGAGVCPCSSPATRTISISGSNIVSGFCFYNTTLGKSWKFDATLDGSYTVTWVTIPAGACQWRYLIGTSVGGSSFSDAACVTYTDGDTGWLVFDLILRPQNSGKYKALLFFTSPEVEEQIYLETESNETFSPISCDTDDPTFSLPLASGYGGAGGTLTVSVT